MGQWIRLDTDWYMHPKFAGLQGEAALFWALVAWSNHYMTDGHFDHRRAETIGNVLGMNGDAVQAALVTLVKRSLLSVTPSGYDVHGYLERYADSVTRKAARERARVQTRERVRRLRSVRRNANVTRVTQGACNAAVPSYPLPSSSDTVSKRRKSRVTVKKGWPAELALDDTMRAYAKKFGCKRPDLAFASFRDRSLATGVQYLDWPAAWRNWCRNHDRFGCACQSVPATPRPREYFSVRSQEEKYARQEQATAAKGSSSVEGRPVEKVGDILGTFNLQGKAKAT